MRTRLRPALSAHAALAALALAPTAAAAPPLPFGHACVPREGALSCPTASDAARVPSFDGVPLDVDVFLPPTGDGPFPTVAMLHGFAGSKGDPEAGGTASTTNASFYARRGYAVLVPSARGFGRSCGVPDSRTPDCARGWLHLADQRFEVRDVQQLLGLLVDEGVARADAIGATGISYGGGQTLMLAMLRNRIVIPTGATAPWTSPAGRPLSLAAAWARWPWSDLADSLLRNGRLGPATFASPVGVPIQAWLDLLSSAAGTGFVAPPGADPSADLTTMKQRIDRGEPYGADMRAALTELHRFHGALGVPGGTAAPLLIQSGFTDDLFPIGQGLRLYDLLRARTSRAPVALQLGDLGHSRAANHPGDATQMAGQAIQFFDANLKPGSGGRAPAPGAVTAFLQSCPRTAARGGGPISATSFARLTRGALRLSADGRQSVSSSGGDAALAAQLNPLQLDPCRSFLASTARGTAVVTCRTSGFTLLGRTAISARVRVRGSGAQLVGRLWDVDPATGRQRLIDRGVVRLRSARTVSFQLNGNGWRFRAGHRVRVEILGRDAPTYRPSNGAFRVDVSRLRVTLPARERRPR